MDKLNSKKELKAEIGELKQLLFNSSLSYILSNWEAWTIKWNAILLVAFPGHPGKLQIWKAESCAKLISSKEIKLRIELVERYISLFQFQNWKY